MAIEPTTLSDVLVDHIGIDDPMDLDSLHETIRLAGWDHQGRSTRVLTTQCHHPAVQVALERHVGVLDTLLAEVHRSTAEIPKLATLPTHATADGVRAADDDGTEEYRSAGAQFRLAEDKVQELLMGEQLYSNRGLAVRELYQNALDACRYRRAREEYLSRTADRPASWAGKIEFRQGIDAAGISYIECQDNGIGMSERELIDVFAEAGRRSVDLPEVIEEMNHWDQCDPPIPFFPNSRFGVGVLSYFMIADELVVDTIRMGRDGRPGDHLHVTISGPGALFRIRNLGPGQSCGTTVRLRLARRSGEAQVSCTDILQRILWVAEFDTVATQGATTLRWRPGELPAFTPVGSKNPLNGSDFRSTRQITHGDGTIWWCNGIGGILADGLWAGHPVYGAVINLAGSLAPELSVDRNQIQEMGDEAALDSLIIAAIPLLLESSVFELTPGWIYQFSRDFPTAGDVAFDEIVDVIDVTWSWHGVATRSIREVGCMEIDSRLFSPSPTSYSDASHWSYLEKIDDRIIFGRLAQWKTTENTPARKELAHPGDSETYATLLDVSYPRTLPSRSRLLFAAALLRRTPVELAFRLRVLGLPSPQTDNLEGLTVTAADQALLSRNLDGRGPLERDVIPLGHVVSAAVSLGRTVDNVLDRCTELGLPVWPAARARSTVNRHDLILLSAGLAGSAPWIGDSVSLTHILLGALHTGRTPTDLRSRLHALGYRTPGVRTAVEAGFGQDDAELITLGTYELSQSPLPVSYVTEIARKTGRAPASAAARLRELGYPVARSVRLSTTPEQIEIRLLGTAEHGNPVSRYSLMVSADTAAVPPSEAATALRGMGLAVAEIYGIPSDGALGTDEIFEFGSGAFLPLGAVLALAFQTNHSIETVAAAFEKLGIAAPDVTDLLTSQDDATLISSNLNGSAPWVDIVRWQGNLPIAQVIAVASRLRKDPGEVADRARYLGMPVADPHGAHATPVSADANVLLSRNLGESAPWIDDDVYPAHVLRAAARTGRPVSEIVAMLSGLGFQIAPVPDVRLSADERRMMDVLLGPSYARLRKPDDRRVSRAALLGTAALLGHDPHDVSDQATRFGLLPLRPNRWVGTADLDIDDAVLLDVRFGYTPYWLEDITVHWGHVLAAAARLGIQPADVSDRLQVLGFRTASAPVSVVDDVDAVDLVLLSPWFDRNGPYLEERTVPRAHVLRAACVLGCDVSEVSHRYRRLGFVVPDLEEINDDARVFLTVALHDHDTVGADGPAEISLSYAQVLGAAEFCHVPPAQVAATLRGLGLTVENPRRSGDSDLGEIGPHDAFLLSAYLNGEGPWLGSRPVPLAHVLGAAGSLRWTPERVARRLAALGCQVPELHASAAEAFIDGVDQALLDMIGTDVRRYEDRAVSRGEVLAASYRFRWTPERVVARFVELGFAVPSYGHGNGPAGSG